MNHPIQAQAGAWPEPVEGSQQRREQLPAWLFTIREVELKNNPPAGDLEVDFMCSPGVDLYVGQQLALPLFVLVIFPPALEVPILESEPQFLAASKVELVENML